MAIYKNVLKIIALMAFIPIILSGCNQASNAVDFPTDKNGYPKIDTAQINDQLVTFNYDFSGNNTLDQVEFSIENKSNMTLSIAQGLPIHLWVIDTADKDGSLTGKIVPMEIAEDNMLEGPSNAIQQFEFKDYKGKQLKLKKINADAVFEDGVLKKNIDFESVEAIYELDILIKK